MKIVYMSHRYHTNQNTIMKGWKERGDEICFISQYAGKIEDYTYVRPIVAGYSLPFRIFYKCYMALFSKRNPNALDIRLKIGIPPLFKLSKILREFQPDLVILRERSVYTIGLTALCRFFKYPHILYVMNPVWEKPKKKDLAHKLVWRLTPKYRLTPSLVHGISYEGKVKDPFAFYAPYLMEPQVKPEEREYNKNGIFHILEVGKYEKRKNHFLMVDAVTELSKKYVLKLTIIGEVSNGFHKEYFRKLSDYIAEKKMDPIITLKQNLKKAEMMQEYQKADLFVLPSTGEPGSVTNLEGMAFSIPVICGEDNGTACYIVQGETGYVFRDNDKADLIRKMELIIRDEALLKKMGRNAYQHVLEHFQFDQYREQIEKVLYLCNTK